MRAQQIDVRAVPLHLRTRLRPERAARPAKANRTGRPERRGAAHDDDDGFGFHHRPAACMQGPDAERTAPGRESRRLSGLTRHAFLDASAICTCLILILILIRADRCDGAWMWMPARSLLGFGLR